METGFNCLNHGFLRPFKSYYVVWKLADARAKKKEDDGLNRTMQYGNR